MTSEDVTRIPLAVEDYAQGGPSKEGHAPAGLILKRVRIERAVPRYSVLRLEVRTHDSCGVMAVATQAGTLHEEHLGSRDVASGSEGVAVVSFPLPDWDRMDIVVELRTGPDSVVEIAKVELIQDLADEGRYIHGIKRSADSVRVQVDCPGNRILLFTDADYPGWRALVDGVSQPILRANDAFKALALAEGKHDVEFVFRSHRVHLGVAVSLTTMFVSGSAIIILQCLNTRRRRPASAGQG
jgi:hypothetical protein